MQQQSFIATMLQARGGRPNEYADVVSGTVLSANPLKIQLSPKLILTSDFFTLSKRVTEYTVKVNGEDITIDESLQDGDTVIMIRQDGGQHFFVLERTA
jgi:hypothetical protein